MEHVELATAPVLDRDQGRRAELREHVGRLGAGSPDRPPARDVAVDPCRAVRPVHEKFPADSIRCASLELAKHRGADSRLAAQRRRAADRLAKREIDVDTGAEPAHRQPGATDDLRQAFDQRCVFLRPARGRRACSSRHGLEASARARGTGLSPSSAQRAWKEAHFLPQLHVFAHRCRLLRCCSREKQHGQAGVSVKILGL